MYNLKSILEITVHFQSCIKENEGKGRKNKRKNYSCKTFIIMPKLWK
jgi:hypothetical protein